MQKHGHIALGSFYARRILRLYPALLVMIAVVAPIFWKIGGSLTFGDLMSAMFYGSNYHEMAGGNRSGLANVVHPFGVLWSLAVEEHYYLFFPLLTLLLGRSLRRFGLCLVMLIVLTTAWRFHVAAFCASHPHEGFCVFPLRVEHGTDTRIDSILYGAVLAVLLASRAANATLRWLRSPLMQFIGALLILASLADRNPGFRDTWRFTLQGVGLTACVGGVLYDPRLARIRRLFEHRIVVFVGRLSYSIYLWHWIVLVLASALLPSWFGLTGTLPSLGWTVTVFPTLLAASLAAAAASYYGVERPMLSLRRSFGSHAGEAVPHPVAQSSLGAHP
jgi:peptidoglycan/LPS O-acetylase OafA/YrhL